MNKLFFTDKYFKKYENDILELSNSWNFKTLNIFFINIGIDSSIDQDIIISYTSDWSNIPDGYADILVRPKSTNECAIILKICDSCEIPITISAGRTNLTGSATPFGGLILSTKNLISPEVKVDIKNKTVLTPVGLELEKMRKEVIKQSNKKLYYPVNPTSRNDAYVGGTISCNASGFIPGDKGATRYWVDEITLILINGFSSRIKRGKYKSKNGEFIIDCNGKLIKIEVSKYKRPKIKNASGPYSIFKEEIDFIDLIVGSEGIFGLITMSKFKLAYKPKEFLDLFIILEKEKEAIELHEFLFNYFNKDLSQLNALEYFGHNCQNYMKHNDYFFKNKNDIAVYLQFPIHKGSLEQSIEDWICILTKFKPKINLDNIISLNDKINFDKFFESRHSIPDNALTKTKQIGGISIITDTIVPIQNFKNYLEKIHYKLQNKKIEYILFGHLGDCHLHFHLIPRKDQEKEAIEIYNYMIDLCTNMEGIYSAEHGTGKRKRIDFEKCYGKKAVKMLKKTKKGFDPKNLLNIGNIIN